VKSAVPTKHVGSIGHGVVCRMLFLGVILLCGCPAHRRSRGRPAELPCISGEIIFSNAHQRTTSLLRRACLLPAPHTNTMASQKTSRALRAALRQASTAAPRVQQRTFVSAVKAASRPTVKPVAPSAFLQQTRGKKTVDFAGDKEVVFERDDWPRDKLLVRSNAWT
jgi:hypothetical protein